MDAKSYVDLKPNPNIPDFRPGDSVRVHAKVVEGERERIQVFEGVVIRIRTRGAGSTFTVRRVSHGVGVERVFPYYSPLVEKVEVSRVGRVRRARLYYLRERVGKAARIRPGSRARFEALTAPGAVPEPEYIEEEVEEAGEEADAEAALEETAEAEAGEAEEAPEDAATEDDSAVEAIEEAIDEAAPEPEAEAEEPGGEETPEEEATEAGEETPDAEAASKA